MSAAWFYVIVGATMAIALRSGDDSYSIENATDEELMAGLDNEKLAHIHAEIMAEVNHRVDEKRKLRDAATSFNPKVDISADARYLWNKLFIWFWLIPALACLLWFMVTARF